MPASANSLNSIPCEDRKGGTIRYCPVVADISASASTDSTRFLEKLPFMRFTLICVFQWTPQIPDKTDSQEIVSINSSCSGDVRPGGRCGRERPAGGPACQFGGPPESFFLNDVHPFCFEMRGIFDGSVVRRREGTRGQHGVCTGGRAWALGGGRRRAEFSHHQNGGKVTRHRIINRIIKETR